MEFKVQETDQGLFEIIQTKPVVVGTFPDREVAKKVFDFLVEDYMEAMPAVAPAPVELALVDEKPPAEPAKPPVSQVPETGGNVVALKWSDAELEQAFARLIAGERVKDVAAGFGKSWTELRACWAAHKRNNKNQLDKALTPSEINDADQDECRLCGKTFRPTAASLDLCARCRRET